MEPHTDKVVPTEPIPMATGYVEALPFVIEENNSNQSDPPYVPPSVDISIPHPVEKIDTQTESEIPKVALPVSLGEVEEAKVSEVVISEEKSLPSKDPEIPISASIENPITIVEIKPTGFEGTINIPIELNPTPTPTPVPIPLTASPLLEPKEVSLPEKVEDLPTEESKNLALEEIKSQLDVLQTNSLTPQMEQISKSEAEVGLTEIIKAVDELNVQEELEPPPPPPVLFREPSSSDPEAPDSQHNYFQHLGAYRVQMSDWDEAITSSYIYDNSDLSQDGLNRINKEIKALTRSLPCEPSGAVFLHIDSSNLSRMKAIISGTEDTPYEHGLFLFDIKLDANYPSTPPKMTIKTTGNGSLRFNPNLYDSGYVCLSIINTWGGDPEEMWNPSYSTLMQVFLSIQALVMNNDVIQKEPGYESYATNGIENRDYMTIVKYGNIMFAMIDMLKNPPFEFKDIIMKHFSLKKEKILQTVEKWLGDLEGIGAGFNDCIVSSHNSPTIGVFTERQPIEVFQQIFAELKEELEKIPNLT